MRIILEVLSGASAGRKTVLASGQVLRVGRTGFADFTISDDGHLSGVHFAVETDNTACYVQDLGSSNGTLLNGQPLAERNVLRDGDEIRAGSTRFVVHAEGDAPEEAVAAAAAIPSPPAARPTPGAVKVPYTAETCDSGLTLCRGEVEDLPPAALAEMLGRKVPLYLIVDFKKLGDLPPEELESADNMLFEWLDASTAAALSPLVISPGDFADWPTLIEQGWGNDAVVCLFSQQEKPDLLAQLRANLRIQPAGDSGGGIVGYCWPSVMAPLLAHYTPEFVQRLLNDIDAVLVEFPDLPLTWQVFGREQVVDLLDELGLVRSPSEEVAAQSPEDQA